MRKVIIMVLTFVSTLCCGQQAKIAGTYSSIMPAVDVTFSQDSTFQYVTKEQHPTFYRGEDFSEKGQWVLSGDTIVLNPQLSKKVFVESEFKEEEDYSDTNLVLTCNHIKRYFDPGGNITRTDTLQIDRLDYSLNEFRKKKQVRITSSRTVRCTFAGYIPKEIITNKRTVTIQRPREVIACIFIGCYELQGTEKFIITNAHANHFTMNVYSNYYGDGQIRQVKFLAKNENILYTRQKKNGDFGKDNFWAKADGRLKKQKAGGSW